MATSSTLKTLKEQDGSEHLNDVAAPPRPRRRWGRLTTWRQSIWRRRWLSMGTAWAACLLGWAVIMLWPTNYIASAVVHADLAKLADHDGAGDLSSGKPVAMLKSELLTAESLDIVRREAALDAAKGESLETDLMLRSTVPPVFVVAYEHQDPDKARRVLETLIAGYRSRLDARTAAAAQAAKNLDEGIQDHQDRLQRLEAELTAFRRTNADYLNAGSDRTAEIALLEEELAGLEERVETAVADRDDLAARLAQVRAPEDEEENAEPPRSEQEIAAERRALESELAKLQERYADSHPYVVAVFDAIGALEAEAQAASAAREDLADSEAPLDRESLEQRHGELIADVSALTDQLGSKRQEIEHLEALTKTASSVEAELSKFEADKKDLTSALADLQQSRDELGDDVGGEATQEAFRLIKRPELPTDPVGPSRLMALAAVLLGGTGLGAAIAVFCNRLKGVFESAWQLRQRFDVGVLGTLSEVMTPAERKRLGHARLAFGLACLALVGLFGGLVAAELTDSLAPFGDRLRARLLG